VELSNFWKFVIMKPPEEKRVEELQL